jgi:hypothetical protein
MLPAWASQRQSQEDRQDLERIRAMTPSERLAELDEILVLMESILHGREDREEELDRHSPIPEGWLRIVAKARRGPKAE